TGSISGFIGLRTTKTQQGVGLFLCYKIDASELTIRPQDDEISNAQLFTIDEFSKLEWVSAAMRGFAEVALKSTSPPLIFLCFKKTRPYHLVFSDGRMTLSEEVVR
ncbi:MAG: hypothetical protein VX778_04895, partial [Candidatus Thermoplasmatota archaeon]|nr:hypothetical protein [Candidatus Thermoplasmatota archaeon]